MYLLCIAMYVCIFAMYCTSYFPSFCIFTSPFPFTLFVHLKQKQYSQSLHQYLSFHFHSRVLVSFTRQSIPPLFYPFFYHFFWFPLLLTRQSHSLLPLSIFLSQIFRDLAFFLYYFSNLFSVIFSVNCFVFDCFYFHFFFFLVLNFFFSGDFLLYITSTAS